MHEFQAIVQIFWQNLRKQGSAVIYLNCKGIDLDVLEQVSEGSAEFEQLLPLNDLILNARVPP